MEDLKLKNIQAVGRIQHGEQTQVNNKTRTVEYGYFIPKVKDSNLQFLANRFNEIYNKKTAIPIRIINEEPFTIRRVKYNQGGTNCYCMDGETNGKQKVSNKWQTIECNANCPHRVKQKGAQKPACNREGRLIFMLPKINTDRIWDMKITSQEAINTLDNYFKLQKLMGNSIKGDYIVYLKKKEQTTEEGQKFNNTLVDIIKKEDFISKISNQNIPKNQITQSQTQENKTQANQTSENQTNLSTGAKQNVETLPEIPSKSELKEQKDVAQTETKNETKQETKAKATTTKKTSKKAATDKSKDTTKENKEPVQEQITMGTEDTTTDNIDKYYVLYQTSTRQLQKDGKPTEYLFANFADMNDKTIDVAIPPNLKEELLQCNIGTVVELELGTSGTLTFAKNIKYINKLLKEVAA